MEEGVEGVLAEVEVDHHKRLLQSQSVSSGDLEISVSYLTPFPVHGTLADSLDNSRGGGSASVAPRAYYDDIPDVYSDDEETGTSAANIVDISAVSGLGESAPTSLIRSGRETGKAKEEEDEKRRLKLEKREKSRKGKQREAYGSMVKPEPVSPEKRGMDIDMDDMEEMMNSGVRPPIGLREDDHLMDGDLNQDRDEQGRRLNEENKDGVIESQAVDLSESEEEEEEESMMGDFVPTPGFVSLLPPSLGYG